MPGPGQGNSLVQATTDVPAYLPVTWPASLSE
jgi:hypothetical protein